MRRVWCAVVTAAVVAGCGADAPRTVEPATTTEVPVASGTSTTTVPDRSVPLDGSVVAPTSTERSPRPAPTSTTVAAPPSDGGLGDRVSVSDEVTIVVIDPEDAG